MGQMGLEWEGFNEFAGHVRLILFLWVAWQNRDLC